MTAASLMHPQQPHSDGKKRAVVVRSYYAARDARRHFPNYHILHYGQAIAGWCFDEIAVLASPETPSERETQLNKQWLIEVLHTRVTSGGSITYFF